jgi:hypothetical protein
MEICNKLEVKRLQTLSMLGLRLIISKTKLNYPLKLKHSLPVGGLDECSGKLGIHFPHRLPIEKNWLVNSSRCCETYAV